MCVDASNTRSKGKEGFTDEHFMWSVLDKSRVLMFVSNYVHLLHYDHVDVYIRKHSERAFPGILQFH